MDPATTEISTLSLHGALPILIRHTLVPIAALAALTAFTAASANAQTACGPREQLVKLLADQYKRSEEHTSELQSRQYLVCRLLLEKKSSIEFRPIQS